jgi:hypothetical protein
MVAAAQEQINREVQNKRGESGRRRINRKNNPEE